MDQSTMWWCFGRVQMVSLRIKPWLQCSKNPTFPPGRSHVIGSEGCCTIDRLNSTRRLRGSSDLGGYLGAKRTWWLQLLQLGLPSPTFKAVIGGNSHRSQAVMRETMKPPVLFNRKKIFLFGTKSGFKPGFARPHLYNHYTTMSFVSQGDLVVHFIARTTLVCCANCKYSTGTSQL